MASGSNLQLPEVVRGRMRADLTNTVRQTRFTRSFSHRNAFRAVRRRYSEGQAQRRDDVVEHEYVRDGRLVRPAVPA
eukprot:1180345-Prorocentrum_minimum.AAC.1